VTDREEHWEQRLAVPVLVAALASVPAVFLTLMDAPYETVGTAVNWVSGAVLVGETAVLFAVSRDKRDWLRRRIWLLLLTAGVAAAVVLAVGPLQVLRLLRVFGALRIARAGRIVKAARILSERTGLDRWWSRAVFGLAGLLVAVFVGVVLADPTSGTRELLESWTGTEVGGPLLAGAVLVAGALLAAATWVVVRQRRDAEDA